MGAATKPGLWLISLSIQTDTFEEAKIAAINFTASIASAYRLPTCRLTYWELNNELPGLNHLLQHKIRDPARKTAVNWITETVLRMTRRKAFERWGKSNCEVTPDAMWPTAKSIMKRERPKAPTAVHGPWGLKFLPLQEATRINACLENQVHTTWRVWWKPWTVAAGSSRSCVWSRGQQSPWKSKPLWRIKTDKFSQIKEGLRNL
jgi:hypothetical protein